MATFKKLSSGLYQAQVCVKGKRRAQSFAKLSTAKQWARQIELDLARGTHPDAHLPLSHFIQKHADKIRVAHKHSRHEEAVLSYLLDDPISDIPAETVTTDDINAWIHRRRTIPSRKTGKIVKELSLAAKGKS